MGFFKSKEPQIKGIICGTDLFMTVLKDNFSVEDIYTGDPASEVYLEFDYADDEYFYSYIFDINTGKLYSIDDSLSNKFVTYLKPLYQDKYDDVAYTYKSERKGNSIKVYTNMYETGYDKDSWEDNIHLYKLTNTFFDNGKKIIHNCIYFPLPGTINLRN